MSKLETNTIDTVSGTSTLQVGSTNTSTITLGVSGDTINVPSGVTINNNGTQTGFGGTNTPAFEAYLSADQVIGDGAVTKIQFNTEVYDDGSGYDNSSNYRFTVPSGEGGTYKFYTTLNFSDNQNAEKIGFRQLYFYKNGSSYAISSFGIGDTDDDGGVAQCSAIIELDADDYVTAHVQYTGTDNVTGQQQKTWFEAFKLSGI